MPNLTRARALRRVPLPVFNAGDPGLVRVKGALISPRWEGGTLELRSPDAFVRWTVTQALDQHEQQTVLVTGPSSAQAVWLEQGASVDASYVYGPLSVDETPVGIRPNGCPYFSWDTGLPVVQRGTEPALLTRFFADTTPEAIQKSWSSGQILADGSPVDPTAGGALNPPQAALSGGLPVDGSAVLLGFVPGHCNRMSLWTSAPATLLIGGQLVTIIAPPGEYVPIGVGAVTTYSELAVDGWDHIQAAADLTSPPASPVAWRLKFWRES